jgi:hypothetical protein
MGFFDTLGDIVLAPVTLPLKAVNTALALPGQAIGAYSQTVTSVAKAASGAVQGVAQAGSSAITGSVGAAAGAVKGIGESLAMPLAIGGAAVLLVILLKEK